MIEARGLTKAYGSKVAVNDLSFTVAPGRVTGFLGPNGAGKSTTMRMLLGLDQPTKGQALIGGKRYTDIDKPLTKIGALLDANWIHPNRSAEAHLRWMAASNGISRKRVKEVLSIVGLEAVAGKAAGKFSLGMKQRLGIAGAILGDPEILLFDEPVNGLDPEGIHWIRTFMQNLAKDGRTVLVSSHLLSEMAQTAEHLIVIGMGRMIADASTKDFIAGSTTSGVKVRSPQIAQLRDLMLAQQMPVVAVEDGLTVSGPPIETIGELAAAHGIVLHELSPQAGSLEEAFIKITGNAVEYGGPGQIHSSNPQQFAPPGPPPGQPGQPGPQWTGGA